MVGMSNFVMVDMTAWGNARFANLNTRENVAVSARKSEC